jgi:hypothetical protein
MLGKIFKITVFPRKSDKFFSDKSPDVSLNSGAFDPILGSSPKVCAAFPPKVMSAIF